MAYSLNIHAKKKLGDNLKRTLFKKGYIFTRIFAFIHQDLEKDLEKIGAKKAKN